MANTNSISIKSQSQMASFIRKVYGHLLLAILSVVIIEVVLFKSGVAELIAQKMLSVSWLLILGGFILIGWIARRMAYRTNSVSLQYAGLISYVVAKSIILVPLLYQADKFAPGALDNAALFTLIGTISLTIIVFITGKDFSFLRSSLYWAGTIAIMLIIAALLLKFRLGLWFDIGMISLAGLSILYDTSKIMKYYRSNKYVANALSLFASIALMFWYAIRMFRRFGRA